MANAPAPAGNVQLRQYKQHAREIADQLRQRWEVSERQDLKGLVDDVQCALADEASHELRNVLFQLSAQLELTSVKSQSGRSHVAVQDLARMRLAVDRATRIVDVFLDRSQAAQMVIPLQVAPFDIGATMREMLHLNGFLDGHVVVELEIQNATIVADEARLTDVMAHLTARFFIAAIPGKRLLIRLSETAEGVDGFIGLAPSHIPTQELMSEFDLPLTIDAMAIDIPYCRAVIERHGGALFVAAADQDANGFGFTLPSKDPTGA